MKRAASGIAILAAAAWVPLLLRPLSPDEGGFLLVASQWRPGSSLYGHYWVDRPPLLLSVFDVAADLGGRLHGALSLRLLGMAAVAVSVLMTALLASRVSPRWGVLPTAIAGVFLSTPLFGGGEVDGELLAVPIVLLGLLLLVRAWDGSRWWAVPAGACAMAAMLVKQNVIDVFVVAAALVVLALASRERRRAVQLAIGVAVGAALTTALSLMLSEWRGTEPVRLWHAVVTFRAHATQVIASSSSSSTSERFLLLLGAAVLSGAPLVIGVLLWHLRGAPRPTRLPDLRWAAVALLVWELFAVGAGGSYWLHYLTGLVPGMVLLALAAAQRPPRGVRLSAVAVLIAAVSCLTAVGVEAASPSPHVDDVRVAAYLRDHSRSGDSVVVGFGHPDIVWGSGLDSPYPLLWSLPVRVRDASLVRFAHLLRGRRAPTWVVVAGDSLSSWGIDAQHADAVLRRHYSPARQIGNYVVWQEIASRPHLAS